MRTDMELDLGRMRRERHAKLQAEMARSGESHLLLLGDANVRYATGAANQAAESSRAAAQRMVALVVAGDAHPHLYTPFPEGAPPDLPADHLHPALAVECDEGVAQLAHELRERVGSAASERIVVDEMSAAMFRLLGDGAFASAAPVLGGARITKTADELECIRRAQRINELAMYDVMELLRPGVRQTELTARFLRRIFELGATSNSVDPIWQPMPPSIADGPYTTNGDVAFPLVTTDAFLCDGDVIWVDTGIGFEGYASDFGRTWIVGRSPTAQQQSQFARWRAVIDAVCDAVRPGVSAGELVRAADKAVDGRRPWLAHFYLAHGVGVDSAEMPLVGTDLGTDFDDTLVMAPGMVLVLEPVIWDDGHAGYRAEDIVAVTEDGYVQLSDFPYTPFGAP